MSSEIRNRFLEMKTIMLPYSYLYSLCSHFVDDCILENHEHDVCMHLEPRQDLKMGVWRQCSLGFPKKFIII